MLNFLNKKCSSIKYSNDSGIIAKLLGIFIKFKTMHKFIIVGPLPVALKKIAWWKIGHIVAKSPFSKEYICTSGAGW